MKITVNKEEFTKELAFVSDVANGQLNKKQAGILFEAEGDTLTLTATNGTAVAVSNMKLEVPITDKLSIATEAKKLVELLPLINSQTVSLSFNDTKMIATVGASKRYSFLIYGEDASSHIKFFSVVKGEGDKASVNTKDFIEGLLSADTFTVNKETNQYVMTNVGISLTPAELQFYSMDGNRAFYRVIADDSPDRSMKLKISNDYTNLLSKMGVAERMDITVMDNDSVLKFEAGQRVVFIRVQVGQLPDIANGMIPKAKSKLDKQVNADAEELKLAVRRIKIAADAKYKKVLFSFAGGVLKINAKHHETEVQEFEEEMNVQGQDSGMFIADGNHMFDFLNKTKNTVTILFSESKKNPVLLLDQQGLHYLVSQM